MRKQSSALTVVRVVCGSLQVLVGSAAIAVGLFFGVFGVALAVRLTRHTHHWAVGAFPVALSAVLLLVAGGFAMLQGVFLVGNRRHTFAITAAAVAMATQAIFHAAFHFHITPAAVGLLAFEGITGLVAWRCGRLALSPGRTLPPVES